MTTSINVIVRELRLLCAAHLMVNEFIYEDFVYAYSKNRIKHLCVVAMCHSAGIGKREDVIMLRITVADKVYDDFRNFVDVQSDTLQVLRGICDIITESPRWNSLFTVSSPSQAQYFRQTGPDKVDGWVCEIPLQVAEENDLCAIPLNGYDYNEDLTGNI